MEKTQFTVTLELEVAGESLSGRLIEADGSERPFIGWLGLVGVIDHLLTAPPEGN